MRRAKRDPAKKQVKRRKKKKPFTGNRCALSTEKKLAINRANQKTVRNTMLAAVKNLRKKYSSRASFGKGEDSDSDTLIRLEGFLTKLKEEESELLKKNIPRKL